MAAPPSEWHLNAIIYPTFSEIVEALQDPGVSVSGTTKQARPTGVSRKKFVRIAKIATKLYKSVKKIYNPLGAQLDDNVSRGKDTLAIEILQSRKHVDTCNTDIAFHSYGANGMVYLIHNCAKYAGLDLAVRKFQQAHHHNIKTRSLTLNLANPLDTHFSKVRPK